MALVAVGTTGRGAGQAGRRRAERPRRERRPGALVSAVLLPLGVLLAAGAWYFLVRSAIDFGQVARGGRTAAWGFCIAATAGATVCLLLVFVLLARTWERYVTARASRRPRLPGGRHHR
jgi:hypothetical protein